MENRKNGKLDKRKTAAVSAAVFTYIKTHEEQAYYASCGTDPGKADAPASDRVIPAERQERFSAWANAGRLSQMQANAMMLMKAR